MEFKDIVMKRYATKSFNGEKIPKEKVNQLLEIIRNAPSSSNFQPWKIMVIEDQATKEKLAPAAYNQKQITTCSHLLVFCVDTDLKGKIALVEKAMAKNGASPEAIKGFIDYLNGHEAKMTPEKRLPWAQRQLYLALGNALNGAKSLGFDSCPMEGFSSEEFSKILNLPSNIVPTALCPIGFANDTPRPKFRLPKEDIFF
jgi:nitroreductase